MAAPSLLSEIIMGDIAPKLPCWVCPIHGFELVESGEALGCPADHGYPRVDGIPRFVPESGYADAFGAQWLRYRRTQLDSYTGTAISRNRARRCLGQDLWDRLRGMRVLEAGCGAGRFTEILLGAGAAVMSIDLSHAVDANQLNFPQSDAHRVAQADVCAPPCGSRQFDIVFSLGVVQHTPNPEQTIVALYEQVRPGGWLVLDHYTYSYKWLVHTSPLFRLYFRRLAPAVGLERTEHLVNAFLPLLRNVGRKSRHPKLYTRLLKTVIPVNSYYHIFPELSDEHQREWALLDTHDALTDWYKHRRTRGQIERLFCDLGAESVDVVRAGNGIEARGRRPQ